MSTSAFGIDHGYDEVSKGVPGAKLLRALTTPAKLEETEVVTSAGKRTIRQRKPTKYFEGENTDVITHDHNGNVTGHIAPSRAALNRHGTKVYAGIGAGILGGTAAGAGGAGYAIGHKRS